MGYLGEDAKRTAEILNLLLDEGVNLIDTAACYPNSEDLIRKAIGHRRDEYILVSKCGHRAEGLTGTEWSQELISRSIDRSLKLLGTDRLDAMLLHSCETSVLKKGDALGALVKAQEEGKILHLGYSGDNEAAVYAAGLPQIEIIETSVNVCDQNNIDLVLPITRKNRVGVLAKRPIANAAWKAVSEQRGIYQDYVTSYSRRFKAMRLRLADFGIDGDPATEWPRIALQFTLSVPGVHCAIVGTTNPVNARLNLDVIGSPHLAPEIVGRIRSRFTDAEARSASRWLGLT